MFMTLKREWEALDVSKNPIGKAKIPAGRHEIERIPNPFADASKPGSFWLVLKGTMIGMSEGSWREWMNDGSLITNKKHSDFGKPIDWQEYEIVIEE